MMAQRSDTTTDVHDIVPEDAVERLKRELGRTSNGPRHLRRRCNRCKGTNIREKCPDNGYAPGNRLPQDYQCHSCGPWHFDEPLPPIAEDVAPEELLDRLADAEDLRKTKHHRTLQRAREAAARVDSGERPGSVAQDMKYCRSTVQDYARVIGEADEVLLAAVQDKYLSLSVVKELTKEDDARRRYRLAEAAIEGYWSSRRVQTERESDADNWETERPDGWLKQFYEALQEVDLE